MANANILSDKSIADDRKDEQVLFGIQPKHQLCFKFFKMCRFLGIFSLVLGVLAGLATLIESTEFITKTSIYRKYVFGGLLVIALFFFFLMLVNKLLFLRRAPFDDWVFEIAEKTIGTQILFYDSRYIYLSYDRHGKEVDKKDFVTEMSDKSVHYSYFYKKTDIDAGFIVVECKKRQPIPTRATFNPEDDKYYNIIPLGKTINPKTQSITAIGWYLNDNEKNEDLYEVIPSVSILIAGGTGCFEKKTVIPIANTIVQ